MNASTSGIAPSWLRARRLAAAASLVALHGCDTHLTVGGGDGGPSTDAPSADVAEASTGDATRATDAGDVAIPRDGGNGGSDACNAAIHLPDGSTELASISSNFDTTGLISMSGVIPPTNEPDVVGAFRFICNASHEGFDDPIVHPCEPGVSHLHEFFGNTLTDAFSTYETLRTTGESTCTNKLNRSSYWIPAMLNGLGQVVRPDYATIYYKRYPASSPYCTRDATACVPMPRGLRFVFGWDPNHPELGTSGGYFNCDGPTAEPGHYADIVEAAMHCPTGNRLGAVIGAPNCWNGQLDSPDHRSHLVYEQDTHLGYFKCPDTHPYIIPTFTIGVWWTVDDTLDRSGTWSPGTTTWFLSSDSDVLGARPGSTFHADWFGAWDDEIMNTWTTHCIDGFLNCSGGDLGNGTGLNEYAGFSWTANPRLVDPPSRP